MNHLGVKLYRVQVSRGIADGSDRAGAGARQNLESHWKGLHLVAVAHPYLLLSADAGENSSGCPNFRLGKAILAALTLCDPPIKEISHQLLAVADAEYGDSAVKHGWINRGASCVIDARWTAGDDDSLAAG